MFVSLFSFPLPSRNVKQSTVTTGKDGSNQQYTQLIIVSNPILPGTGSASTGALWLCHRYPEIGIFDVIKRHRAQRNVKKIQKINRKNTVAIIATPSSKCNVITCSIVQRVRCWTHRRRAITRRPLKLSSSAIKNQQPATVSNCTVLTILIL